MGWAGTASMALDAGLPFLMLVGDGVALASGAFERR